MKVYNFFIVHIEFIKTFLLEAGTISLVCMAIVFPIVFHLLVIPNIEKKIIKKLGYYNLVYNVLLGSKFYGRPFEISFYIIGKSFLKMIGLNPDYFKPTSYALQQANYPTNMFSLMEIFWSIAVVLAFIFFICGGLLLMFLDEVLHL